MKRKCDGCKALQVSHPYDGKCSLGYKIGDRRINDFLSGYKPLEECPKPITWEKLITAEKETSNHGNN